VFFRSTRTWRCHGGAKSEMSGPGGRHGPGPARRLYPGDPPPLAWKKLLPTIGSPRTVEGARPGQAARQPPGAPLPPEGATVDRGWQSIVGEGVMIFLLGRLGRRTIGG